ncbi:MAG: GDP-mannose 4,6-dehydratase, partial [Acidobacteriota bacterium]
PDCCARAVKGMEIVFHLAALIAIPYSYFNPVHCFDVNTRGTVNLVTACLREGVPRLVHTSTSEVYGTPKSVPIYEQHPLQPQSPYAASKVAADVAVLSYVRSFNLPAAIIRPFNTFGPRQSARAIVPTIISQLATSGRVRLGNLKPTRDFVYVADTVNGFLRAGLADGIEGEIIQLSSNQEISIGELAEMIASLMAVPLVIERDVDRIRPENSEVFQLLGCAEKAKALLGWQLSVDLEEGLRRVIDYVSKSVSRYKPSENLI